MLWLTLYISAGKIPSASRPSVSVLALPRADEILVGGLPHRWLGDHPWAPLDLIAGPVYMFHALLPVVFLPWLMCCERRAHMASFCRAFGWMNLMAVSTQLALPTAPPWFHDAYSKSPQVCASLPRAHCTVTGVVCVYI